MVRRAKVVRSASLPWSPESEEEALTPLPHQLLSLAFGPSQAFPPAQLTLLRNALASLVAALQNKWTPNPSARFLNLIALGEEGEAELRGVPLTVSLRLVRDVVGAIFNAPTLGLFNVDRVMEEWLSSDSVREEARIGGQAEVCRLLLVLAGHDDPVLLDHKRYQEMLEEQVGRLTVDVLYVSSGDRPTTDVNADLMWPLSHHSAGRFQHVTLQPLASFPSRLQSSVSRLLQHPAARNLPIPEFRQRVSEAEEEEEEPQQSSVRLLASQTGAAPFAAASGMGEDVAGSSQAPPDQLNEAFRGAEREEGDAALEAEAPASPPKSLPQRVVQSVQGFFGTRPPSKGRSSKVSDRLAHHATQPVMTQLPGAGLVDIYARDKLRPTPLDQKTLERRATVRASRSGSSAGRGEEESEMEAEGPMIPRPAARVPNRSAWRRDAASASDAQPRQPADPYHSDFLPEAAGSSAPIPGLKRRKSGGKKSIYGCGLDDDENKEFREPTAPKHRRF